MPTATLRKPNSLNYLGRIWHKGMPVAVDFDTARALMQNSRFKVSGLVTDTMSEEAMDEKRPSDPTLLYASIREVVRHFDKNDETLWTASGRPQFRAVAEQLGYRVTDKECLDAIGTIMSPLKTRAEEIIEERRETAGLGKRRPGNVVIRGKRVDTLIDTGQERGDLSRDDLAGAVSVEG